jgi:hypothetical protein
MQKYFTRVADLDDVCPDPIFEIDRTRILYKTVIAQNWPSNLILGKKFTLLAMLS